MSFQVWTHSYIIVLVVSVSLIALPVNAIRRGRGRWNRRLSSSSVASSGGCPENPPCWKDCGEAGYMLDSNGCQICACKPTLHCPEIECPGPRGHCPYGYARDEQGCSLCECATPINCSKAICRRYCEHGLKKGVDGCPICECFEPPVIDNQLPSQCVEVDCMMECENGRLLDSNGCETCACRPSLTKSDCPTLKCRNTCVFGRHVNREGCETCSCVSRHRRLPIAAATPVVAPRAEMMMSDAPIDDDDTIILCGGICRMHCQYGFKKDARGCPVCYCNEGPNPSWRQRPRRRRRRSHSCPTHAAMCAMFCPGGFKTDADGCTLCACEDLPGILSQTGKPEVVPLRFVSAESDVGCTPMRRCRKYCPYGFEKDVHGCEICDCVDDDDDDDYDDGHDHDDDDDDDDDDDEMQSDQPYSHPSVKSSTSVSQLIADNRRRACTLQPEVGPCRAAIPRWYYSPVTEQCQEFVYGGCRGNENNFSSEIACLQYCTSNVKMKAKKPRRH